MLSIWTSPTFCGVVKSQPSKEAVFNHLLTLIQGLSPLEVFTKLPVSVKAKGGVVRHIQ